MAGENEMKNRGVNFFGHIRNWYEVHSLEDNKRLTVDMMSNGFNDYWIYLERKLFSNFLDDRVSDDNGRWFWWKLKELAKFAHGLGMKVTVLDDVNVVFVDQQEDPELAELIADPRRPWGTKSTKNRRFTFCPSKPKARELILKSHEELYRDFPIIDAVVYWPYDPGGCGCEDCDPWPETFVTLVREIVAGLHKHHPEAAVYLSAWDMSDEQVDMMVGILREDQSGMFQGIIDKEWLLLDIAEGRQSKRWEKLPDRYERIPYIDLCQIGAWGWHCFTANPYPTRYEAMFKAMRNGGIGSYSSYSEDIHDDINKYIIAGLGKSADKTARELMREYAVRYFQAAVGDDLYEAICMMEDEYTNKLKSPWEQEPIMNLESARKMWSLVKDIEGRIPGYAAESWRWQVLSTRAEISLLLNEIGDLDKTKARIESLFQTVLEASTAEEAHDLLQQADNLILNKRSKLELLKDTIDSFRTDVLEEPGYRTFRVRSALPSYYDWLKMLVEAEETVALATRIFLSGIQSAIRDRLLPPD